MFTNFLVLAQGKDFFGRLSQFIELFPAWVLFLVLLLLLGTLQFALSRHVFWMIPFYLFLCLFSGHSISQLDSIATLIRWWMIICFCIATLNINRNPGVICMMLGIYSVFCLISVLWSPVFLFAFQNSILSILLTLIAARSIAGILSSLSIIKKTIDCYCSIALVFIINGLSNLGSVSGQRYSGTMDSAGMFVIIGGLLMPALLWAFLSKRNVYRWVAGSGLLLVSVLCVLSGQRAGFFAGVIACLALVAQSKPVYIARAIVLFFFIIVVSIVAIQYFPKQSDFLVKRYLIETTQGNFTINTNTTGRADRWQIALKEILLKPILGHGARADKKLKFGFHNSYLQEWYNGGIVGLLLFSGASVTALYKTYRLTRLHGLDHETKQISCLLFSWVTVLIISSCFESKLASPSNIMIFTLVLISAMTSHIELHAKSIQASIYKC